MRFKLSVMAVMVTGLAAVLAGGISGQRAEANTAIEPITVICENRNKKNAEVIPRYTAILMEGPFDALVATPISPDAVKNFRPAEVIEHSSKRLRFAWTQMATVKTGPYAGEMTTSYKFTIDKTNNTFRVTAIGGVLVIPVSGHGRCVPLKMKK